jgi:hypothetical protein
MGRRRVDSEVTVDRGENMSTPLVHRARSAASLTLIAALAAVVTPAAAFCGFYVGKADAKLFNEASQVIIARDAERTVISMRNDFQGELTDFALVVPVPVVLQKNQIHIGDPKIFERIDAYSAPRLAEYFDPNPCEVRKMAREMAAPASAGSMLAQKARRDEALGVAVEARYTVGEYDIVILSATQSNGLETWLRQNGYHIPAGASRALQPYVRQGLKFFVAKVNLAEQAKTGSAYLRPLQFAFEYDRFMLPVRLGMLNARGAQDLVVYALTRNGRVETTNYRTVRVPADVELPTYVRGEFPAFYKALFDTQSRREDYRVVWTEYFWDMAWCDPCAADPLSPAELRSAGVFWLDGDAASPPTQKQPAGGAQPVLLTRLHLRYTRDTLPEDLMFQETQDRQNFQARYVLRHPWQGEPNACAETKAYFDEVAVRQEREALTLARLTGWDLNVVKTRMTTPRNTAPKWWERLWR